MDIINSKEGKFEQAVKQFKKEISSLRTGRANPKMVENVEVKAYGNTQELKTLASISAEDAQTLLVEPYDENIIQDVESALHDADININPVTEGKKIRLPLPDLTAERRKELLNVLSEKAEESKIQIRKVRSEIKDKIEQAEADGEITEDEKYRKLDELDETVDEYNDRIDDIKKEKKKKIENV